MQTIRIYRRGFGLIVWAKGANAEQSLLKQGYVENNEYLWLR